ncbi:MAG: hypothetical protein GF401_08385 [Chitinivibrionales bacterium]|nr:hypothetical protein [Chitinivibrionales bacterium]
MALCKISCHLCPECTRCSAQTKAFVNYCGSNSKFFQPRIDAAIQECRARRGFMFKYETFSKKRWKRITTPFEPAVI